ncbi:MULTISPECIES: cysteine rich repeat-containing protein [unclassified Bradyrhizobium]|uniref:cysteine rich repeat-containing protein n=1 Tax=unclassified Bradyrhizobium TaxID=2631580 RepID=UPI0028ED86DA|nr:MULTISPECIES: cysteine rich repeat-containing protein [unclassified Bradyrhizobium]
MSKLAIAILFTLLLGLADAARAQLLPTDEQRAACQVDYARFCSDVLPGGGRIIACLTRNYAQLADACKKVLDAAKKD